MRILPVIIGLLAGAAGLNAQLPHHEIHASVNHADNEISVRDTIKIPDEVLDGKGRLDFRLNSNLTMGKSGKGTRIEKIGSEEDAGFIQYSISLSPKVLEKGFIVLSYSGKIEQEIVSGAADYARGFSTTDGIISRKGIYLAGSSDWLPSFDGTKLFTFRLTVELDESWQMISQGSRTVNEVLVNRRRVQYDNPDPVDEVYLIAGEWNEYSHMAGDVLVQAFLRKPDKVLADRYLGVTSYYLAMYEDMIGEYPYTKFALIENFWETGLGMPSFTLLGEKVIRFPWILHSSYPHELLHNYWGNSVYVDYSQGNWCEGITAYMADHLIKEQQGLADDYRRTTLQKFTNYVNAENDFPPSEFVSRNNPAEEAIGYGKVLMFNNMLRVEFGDEVFKSAYADFYSRNRFRYASFEDIRLSFERITGKDLRTMFDQWIRRKGAPSLQLSDVRAVEEEKGWKLTYSLKQKQDGEPFILNVPVAVYLENREEVYVSTVSMETGDVKYTHHFDSRPLRVSIDPQFNLMRRLHHSEVPASLSQLFGAKHSAIILPGNSKQVDNYRKLAEMWKESLAVQGKDMEIIYDTDITEIPSGLPVWIAGFNNSFYNEIKINDLYHDFLSDEEKIAILQLTRDHSLVYAIPGKTEPEHTIGFIGTHYPENIMALARKLPHYGGYGYLGFTDNTYTNVLKGVFPVLNSELDYVIPYADNPVINQTLESRRALAYPFKDK